MSVIQEYKLSKDKKLVSNCYVRLEYLNNSISFTTVFKNKCLDSNISDIPTFINDLKEYELNNNNGLHKGASANLGVLLVIMLDKKRDIGECLKLVKELVKDFKGLPYYCYLSESDNKKVRYLNIYVCERYYSENGQKIEILAKKDSYRDIKSGKACLKDDPNAVLWRKKGDIISTKTSKFTSKVRIFRYSTKEQFIKMVDRIKRTYIEICKKLFNVAVKTTITFKKYVLKILTKNQKVIANVWNNELKKMEQEFLKAYEVLDYLNYLDETKQDLDNLFKKYNSLVHENKQFYDDNKKFYIPLKYDRQHFDIDFNSTYTKALNDSDLLFKRFKKELDRIVFNYLPQQ